MTEAVNLTESLPGSYAFAVYNLDGVLLDTETGTLNQSALVREVRPASVHTRKSPHGWRPPAGFDHFKKVFNDPYIEFSTKTGGHIYSGSQVGNNALLWLYNWAAPDTSTLEDLAVNAALLNLSNQNTSISQNFIERKQADDMIAGNIRNIAGSVTDYKRRNPRDWRQVKKLTGYGRKKLGAIPNSWLQTQFGWLPALSDCKGVFDVLKDRDKDEAMNHITVHGFRRNRDHYFWPFDVSGARGAVYSVPETFQFQAEVQDLALAFVRLDYQMESPILAELQRLDLVNPASIAWNEVPYSFVVDWFLPIGDYLQAWTADLGYSFLGGSITTYATRKLLSLAAPSLKYGEGYCSPTGGKLDCFWFHRQALKSSPAPRMPHFRNPFSLTHTADAMSLLVNALR